MSFTAIVQLFQYIFKYDYCNLLKNRLNWTSVEVFLRGYSETFRTATIKNTHTWLLPMGLFQK